MRIEKLHIHFGEDVAHNPALVVFGDIRQLRPGQSMVQIYKKKDPRVINFESCRLVYRSEVNSTHSTSSCSSLADSADYRLACLESHLPGVF
jgi:hypothetical protein